MIIAGEPSGDSLAAELVDEIRRQGPGRICPRIFGLGGPKLQHAGVDLLVDMTKHTVFGLIEALARYRQFKRIFNQALKAAEERQPDLIILVDFGGFNLRFAKALRKRIRSNSGTFQNWQPKIAYFIPPQVWASRAGRAATIAETIDLVISIFPFEKDWYQDRFPQLPVHYVGDPMATRFPFSKTPRRMLTDTTPKKVSRLVLLPGSRKQEIERHLPIMLEALELIRRHKPVEATIVTPTNEHTAPFRNLAPSGIQWQEGKLEAALIEAELALASSGTVTRECAYLRVPTVVIYKLSKLTYEIAKRIVKVRFIAMPNILADKMIFPELIQDAANPLAIAQEALQLFDPAGRQELMEDLERVVLSLGPPGATKRAAKSIVNLLQTDR